MAAYVGQRGHKPAVPDVGNGGMMDTLGTIALAMGGLSLLALFLGMGMLVWIEVVEALR